MTTRTPVQIEDRNGHDTEPTRSNYCMFVILTRVDQVDCATVCRLFDRAHDGVVRDGVSNSPVLQYSSTPVLRQLKSRLLKTCDGTADNSSNSFLRDMVLLLLATRSQVCAYAENYCMLI